MGPSMSMKLPPWTWVVLAVLAVLLLILLAVGAWRVAMAVGALFGGVAVGGTLPKKEERKLEEIRERTRVQRAQLKKEHEQREQEILRAHTQQVQEIQRAHTQQPDSELKERLLKEAEDLDAL